MNYMKVDKLFSKYDIFFQGTNSGAREMSFSLFYSIIQINHSV